MSTDAETRDRAGRTEARLRVAEQVERDKQAAWAEIAADTRRVDENTIRLKALRLAKEKAEAAEAAAAAKAKTTKATKTKAPRKRSSSTARARADDPA